MDSSILYRPHWSEVAADGTILMRASIWDDDGHSAVQLEISPEAEDYRFWRWAIEQERFARVLDEDEVAVARAEFDALLNHGGGGGGSPAE